MNTKVISGFENEYPRLLQASKNEKNVKQKKRYDTVLLYMEGYSRIQISEILHIPHRTVCSHIARYQKDGMDALILGKQSGAPKKLSDEQEQLLFHIISTQTPEEAGVGIFANWTSSLACTLAKEKFGVTFSDRGMRNLFDRIGLSYTRPTYTLEKADPEKQGKFREKFETLKKTSERRCL